MQCLKGTALAFIGDSQTRKIAPAGLLLHVALIDLALREHAAGFAHPAPVLLDAPRGDTKRQPGDMEV